MEEETDPILHGDVMWSSPHSNQSNAEIPEPNLGPPELSEIFGDIQALRLSDQPTIGTTRTTDTSTVPKPTKRKNQEGEANIPECLPVDPEFQSGVSILPFTATIIEVKFLMS